METTAFQNNKPKFCYHTSSVHTLSLNGSPEIIFTAAAAINQASILTELIELNFKLTCRITGYIWAYSNFCTCQMIFQQFFWQVFYCRATRGRASEMSWNTRVSPFNLLRAGCVNAGLKLTSWSTWGIPAWYHAQKVKLRNSPRWPRGQL